jgi:hypothetical protein
LRLIILAVTDGDAGYGFFVEFGARWGAIYFIKENKENKEKAVELPLQNTGT